MKNSATVHSSICICLILGGWKEDKNFIDYKYMLPCPPEMSNSGHCSTREKNNSPYNIWCRSLHSSCNNSIIWGSHFRREKKTKLTAIKCHCNFINRFFKDLVKLNLAPCFLRRSRKSTKLMYKFTFTHLMDKM